MRYIDKENVTFSPVSGEYHVPNIVVSFMDFMLNPKKKNYVGFRAQSQCTRDSKKKKNSLNLLNYQLVGTLCQYFVFAF